jgi:uncharacterized membrane protein YebE (DUF533 family)
MQATEVDWILKAMVAVAAADGRLHAREVGLIQKVYQKQTGHPVDVGGVAMAAETYAMKRDVLVELSAVAGGMSQETKEDYPRRLSGALILRQTVKDYSKWRPVFDRHAGAQKAAGLTIHVSFARPLTRTKWSSCSIPTT